MDLTLEGNVYINGSFEHCCIGIDQGKIVTLKKTLHGEQHLNFGRKLILPAGIDLHVHFRDPGFPQKEDFSTGSTAAAYGGMSCVFDMPNTSPQTTTVRTIRDKLHNVRKKSVVDFGLYAAVTDDNMKYIDELAEYCSGFKLYLGSTTNALHISKDHLQKAFHEIGMTTKIACVHAESEECLRQHRGVEKTLKDHLLCRPARCEEQAIKEVLAAAKGSDCVVHICHLSSCDGFELIRRKPPTISVGVTAHHLLFDVDMKTATSSYFKVNPPIRSHFDREMLWYGITNGIIDVLESDHAPHTIDEKSGDFDTAPSGIPGVETLYPLFLAKAQRNELSYPQLVSLLCEKPAELMHIPKGKIEVGRDADVIVVDYKQMGKIREDQLHSKCQWSPFHGMPALFPRDVFIRGQSVIQEYQCVSSFGSGIPMGCRVQ